MTSLIQSLEEPATPANTQDVDYVAWATEKFRNAEGVLDVAALARGKYESDVNFVPRLTTELSDARREAQTRASLADFMEEYKAGRTVQTNTQNTNSGESQTSTSTQTPLTAADIERISDERWNKKQQEALAQANLRKVKSELQTKWGSGAKDKLEARAKALNVGLDFLESVAVRAPEAFLELVMDKAPAAPPVQPGTYVPPRTNTNTNNSVNTQLGAKSRKQWNDARKTMKSSEYWTPEIQNKILADKIALGDSFDR